MSLTKYDRRAALAATDSDEDVIETEIGFLGPIASMMVSNPVQSITYANYARNWFGGLVGLVDEPANQMNKYALGATFIGEYMSKDLGWKIGGTALAIAGHAFINLDGARQVQAVKDYAKSDEVDEIANTANHIIVFSMLSASVYLSSRAVKNSDTYGVILLRTWSKSLDLRSYEDKLKNIDHEEYKLGSNIAFSVGEIVTNSQPTRSDAPNNTMPAVSSGEQLMVDDQGEVQFMEIDVSDTDLRQQIAVTQGSRNGDERPNTIEKLNSLFKNKENNIKDIIEELATTKPFLPLGVTNEDQPIHCAVRNAPTQMDKLMFLLKQCLPRIQPPTQIGELFLDREGANGARPLHYVANYNNAKDELVVVVSLMQCGASINKTDADGVPVFFKFQNPETMLHAMNIIKYVNPLLKNTNKSTTPTLSLVNNLGQNWVSYMIFNPKHYEVLFNVPLSFKDVLNKGYDKIKRESVIDLIFSNETLRKRLVGKGASEKIGLYAGCNVYTGDMDHDYPCLVLKLFLTEGVISYYQDKYLNTIMHKIANNVPVLEQFQTIGSMVRTGRRWYNILTNRGAFLNKLSPHSSFNNPINPDDCKSVNKNNETPLFTIDNPRAMQLFLSLGKFSLKDMCRVSNDNITFLENYLKKKKAVEEQKKMLEVIRNHIDIEVAPPGLVERWFGMFSKRRKKDQATCKNFKRLFTINSNIELNTEIKETLEGIIRDFNKLQGECSPDMSLQVLPDTPLQALPNTSVQNRTALQPPMPDGRSQEDNTHLLPHAITDVPLASSLPMITDASSTDTSSAVTNRSLMTTSTSRPSTSVSRPLTMASRLLSTESPVEL